MKDFLLLVLLVSLMMYIVHGCFLNFKYLGLAIKTLVGMGFLCVACLSSNFHGFSKSVKGPSCSLILFIQQGVQSIDLQLRSGVRPWPEWLIPK